VFEIGSTLREARVRRKVTLQQAEDDTKIRVKYIQAMENEDFDVMPSTAYVKGFLRTYSTYLGLDADVMLEEYRSRFEPRQEHEPFGGSSALRHPGRHTRRNTLAFVAVVCMLVLALFWMLGKSSEKPNPLPTGAVPSASPSLTRSSSPSASPTLQAIVLSITADRGPVFAEVHKGSATGKLVFIGTIATGSTQHLPSSDKALWLRLDAPSNATLTLNGTKLPRRTETVQATFRVSAQGMVRL